MNITPWNGQQINTPGWYSDIPLERYHSANLCDGPAVSSSNLRTCWGKSPKHMFAQWAENPKAEPREPTRAMVLGAAAHHLLLGEDNFKTKFVAQPETYNDKKTGEEKKWSNNAHACQDWHARQAAEGRTVVTVKELNSIIEMARSLALEPLVSSGLLNGYVECSGFMFDTESELWIKVRPDVIPPTDDLFIDLKTTAEVTTPAVSSSIRSFAYHQQGALIWQVCEFLGQPFASFMLLFVETTNPWCARTVPLPKDDIGRGRQMNRSSLRAVRSGIDTGHWPGPGEGELVEIGLPADERTRTDARLKAEGLL